MQLHQAHSHHPGGGAGVDPEAGELRVGRHQRHRLGQGHREQGGLADPVQPRQHQHPEGEGEQPEGLQAEGHHHRQHAPQGRRHGQHRPVGAREAPEDRGEDGGHHGEGGEGDQQVEGHLVPRLRRRHVEEQSARQGHRHQGVPGDVGRPGHGQLLEGRALAAEGGVHPDQGGVRRAADQTGSHQRSPRWGGGRLGHSRDGSAGRAAGRLRAGWPPSRPEGSARCAPASRGRRAHGP